MELSVQELEELLYWAERKEEMEKKFQNEELKEKEHWGKQMEHQLSVQEILKLEEKKEELKKIYLNEKMKEKELWTKKTADMKKKFLKEKKVLDKKMKEMKQKSLTDSWKAQKCMVRPTISRKRLDEDEKEAPITKRKKKEEKDTRKNKSEERLAEGGSEKPSLPDKSQTEIYTIKNTNAPPTAAARDSKTVKAICGKNKKAAARLLCGTHETQVSEGGEADLHKHFVGCKKNPGHAQYVPVKDFDATRLPKGYHDNDLAELIKATADLTVRVDVKKTSPERPQFWPKTTAPYPFYNASESGAMRTGTGVVLRVVKGTQKKEPCKCLRCRPSNTPSKVWGKVRMYTSTQLIFDDLEARHTTCRLFYDGSDSPLVTLDGWGAVNIVEDRCWLECVTCNVALLNKLEKMVKRWNDNRYKIKQKYKISGDDDKLIFIVSHPHGSPKQVSVGHLINRYVIGGGKTKYTYTACTCPGSSGAYVNSLCYNSGEYNDRHVHCGVNSEGTNISGAGRDSPE